MLTRLLYSKTLDLYSIGGILMWEFNIAIRSFAEVRDFVSLAMVQTFPVTLGSDNRQVNAKNFIGLISLDFSRPLTVRANCSREEFEAFSACAARFRA